MNTERFQRVRELFEDVSSRQPGERAPFLERACGPDGELRREVEQLLHAHERAGEFLEKPALVQEDATTENVAGDPLVGTLLGARYIIQNELGRGAFGVVYLAHDQQVSSKPVVVKVITESTRRSDMMERRFRQEIAALAKISHPSVVGVLDVGRTDGADRPFLVMEFVPGSNLRKAMAGSSLPASRVAAIIRQVGQALTAAHERGVWHRDLKPENIMLRDLGNGEEMAVVIDFGVASVRDPDTTQSMSGMIAGSPAYMAPEQLQGRPEAASDIFALGLIAHELLIGRRPARSSQGGTQLHPGIPRAARELIARAVSPDPAGRFGKAREFGEALAAALTETTPRKRPMAMVWMVAAALVLAAGAAWLSGRRADVRSAEVEARFRQQRNAATAKAYTTDALFGVTIWQLRPFANTPGYSERVLFQEKEFIPVRVSAGAALPEGSLVRLGIEVERSGYLYVIDREQYAGGASGDPVLIFPTRRIRGGDNRVSAGHVVELPDPGETVPCFTLKRSRADQTAELLTILVTPEPLSEVTVGDEAQKLDPALVKRWEQTWPLRSEALEAPNPESQPYTRAEKLAGSNGAPLASADPLPQTIYRIQSGAAAPVLVHVPLRMKAR